MDPLANDSLDLLRDEPVGAATSPLVVALAHGAGAGKHHPFLAAMAAGLASRGIGVARFDFPYMAARRGRPDSPAVLAATWTAVVEALGGGDRVVLAGKSLGGRIASTIVDRVGARGLVCLGYPFHPPGAMATPTRIAHLATLTTPALIVQGSRDPFGNREEVATYPLSASIRMLWLEDGDHSLVPRKRSGFTVEQHRSTALDEISGFVRGL